MALLPLLFDQDPIVRRMNRWSSHVNPDELAYSVMAPFMESLKSGLHHHRNEIDKDFTIEVDKDHFQASIDVQQFKPDEVTVKLVGDNTVLVEGKHEEKQDEHGYISRHFVRKYVLPKHCDLKHLKSRLSSDGVLSIVAPKKEEDKQLEYKEIPIIKTGKPIKGVKRLQQSDSPKSDKNAKKSKGYRSN